MLDSELLRRDLAGSSSIRCTRLFVSEPFNTIFSHPPSLQISGQMDETAWTGGEGASALLFGWIVGSGWPGASVLGHGKPLCVVGFSQCLLVKLLCISSPNQSISMFKSAFSVFPTVCRFDIWQRSALHKDAFVNRARAGLYVTVMWVSGMILCFNKSWPIYSRRGFLMHWYLYSNTNGDCLLNVNVKMTHRLSLSGL